VGPNLVWVKDVQRQSYGKLFFFVDYIGMNTGLDVYPNYFFLLVNVLGLFALLYLPYVYLVWKGFFRNDVLDVWTGLLLFGSFGALVMPFFALQFWHRWMFMLVYPFTFYAVNGVGRLVGRLKTGNNLSVSRVSFKNKVFVMLMIVVVLGAVYLATPFLMVYVGFGIYSIYPICRFFGSAPTVPYQDIDGTLAAVGWLGENMRNDSVAVLHDAFATWALVYLNSSHNVIAYKTNVSLALDLALQKSYKRIFMICWNENGWYNLYVPQGFVEVERFGRISLYEYVW